MERSDMIASSGLREGDSFALLSTTILQFHRKVKLEFWAGAAGEGGPGQSD